MSTLLKLIYVDNIDETDFWDNQKNNVITGVYDQWIDSQQ